MSSCWSLPVSPVVAFCCNNNNIMYFGCLLRFERSDSVKCFTISTRLWESSLLCFVLNPFGLWFLLLSLCEWSPRINNVTSQLNESRWTWELLAERQLNHQRLEFTFFDIWLTLWAWKNILNSSQATHRALKTIRPELTRIQRCQSAMREQKA